MHDSPDLTSTAHSYSDYYNNGGANGGSTGLIPGAGPAPSSTAGGPPGIGGFTSYYQNDGGYSTPVAPGKTPGKKTPVHQGPKPPGTGAPGTYQNPSGPGQSSYGQYSQGYGQGKKNFGQTQGGASAGSYSNYSKAYPSQVTGGPVSQDYGYEGMFLFFLSFMSN